MENERAESELAKLRKGALELARVRKERPTTVHLLAALAAHDGPVRGLLQERKLDHEAILKAGRSFDETVKDAIVEALGGARELAKRARGPSHGSTAPNAMHVLLALLSDRTLAAHRALSLSGVDVMRLRSTTLKMAMGLVSLRREVVQAPIDLRREIAQPEQRRATAVPIMPGKPPASERPRAPLAPVETRPKVDMRPKLDTRPPVEARPPIDLRRSQTKRPARHAEGDTTQARPKQPAIAANARDLTELARRGALATALLREEEVDRILDVLGRRTENLCLVMGEVGAGKTAVVHAVAHRLVAQGDPRRLLELDPSRLVQGTMSRGALADKLAAIRKELADANETAILFADDMLDFLALGDELTAELKVGLSERAYGFLGASTAERFKKALDLEPTLAKRCGVVEVVEPPEEDAFFMVKAASAGLEEHHGRAFDDETIARVIGWTSRYLTQGALPGKAIGVLDLAGARARREGVPVTCETAALVACEICHVPVGRLLENDRERFLTLTDTLKRRVIGHEASIEKLASHLRRNAAALGGNRPIGSFLLLGPTGVGKTETAKAIAEILFGSDRAMTRIDMSEYAEPHAVARLIGAPPGYVGHEAGGFLTEALRKRPYQVVLLDEVEKAHEDVLQAFLQVFDEGHLTDGRGRTVSFRHAVIVMTSNIGAREVETLRAKRTVGFASDGAQSNDVLEGAAFAAAKKTLAPELYNRIDEVLFFAPLGRREVRAIAKKQLADLAQRLDAQSIRLEVDADAIDALLDRGGFEPTLGARPMRRAIARFVETPIADMILSGDLRPKMTALVSIDAGEIAVDALEVDVAAE